MKPEGLRGVELHPVADVGLPVLMMLAVAAAVSALGAAFRGVEGFVFLPGVGLWAMAVALESYLFTTIFFVREVDLPNQLRWVEGAVMAVLAKWLVTLPVADGVLSALWTGADQPGVYFGLGLLAWAWWFGMRTARWVGPLHPGTARRQALLGSEGKKHNDHGEAYESIRAYLLSMLATVGLVAAVADWAQGNRAFWGWTWASVWLLVLALATCGALLAAARLRQQVTWMQEGITPPDSVLSGWMAMALPLVLTPFLLALVLPMGPRLPVERWLLQDEQTEERTPLPPPAPGQSEQPAGDPMLDALKQLSGDTIEWPPWLGSVLYLLGAAVAGGVVLWVINRAARQLAERAGRDELRGIWAWLGALASLWLALLGALGGAARSALAGPAAALEGALSEAGVLGRFLPFGGRAPSEPRAAVRYFFARLQGEGGRRLLRRSPGTTAAEYGAQLGAALPEQAAEIERLTRAYEAARYSTAPLPDSEVSAARRAWVTIARALERKR